MGGRLTDWQPSLATWLEKPKERKSFLYLFVLRVASHSSGSDIHVGDENRSALLSFPKTRPGPSRTFVL